jgi:hypothetical protein
MKAEVQRMAALARANEIRTVNRRFRDELEGLSMREARNRVADALMSPDACVQAMPVDRLLRSIHHVGEQKVARVLRSADLGNFGRRVGSLSERQRLLIAATLRAPGPLTVSRRPGFPVLDEEEVLAA